MKYQHLQFIINDDTQIKVVAGGRHSGLTTLIFLEALKSALLFKNDYNYILMPTYKIIDYRIESFIELLNERKIYYTLTKRDYTIHLDNGAKIIFRSTTHPDRLRGLRCNWIGLDDAIYFKDNILETLLPCLRPNGKILVCSSLTENRNNELFDFYQLFSKGLDNTNTNIKSFRIKTSDNPYIKEEYLETMKQNFTQSTYLREFEAEFLIEEQII
jgi:phage terminase large subunit